MSPVHKFLNRPHGACMPAGSANKLSFLAAWLPLGCFAPAPQLGIQSHDRASPSLNCLERGAGRFGRRPNFDWRQPAGRVWNVVAQEHDVIDGGWPEAQIDLSRPVERHMVKNNGARMLLHNFDSLFCWRCVMVQAKSTMLDGLVVVGQASRESF